MDLSALAACQLSDFDCHLLGLVFREQQLSLTLVQAYEVQFEIARLREQRGERVSGYKIGCISRTRALHLTRSACRFSQVVASPAAGY